MYLQIPQDQIQNSFQYTSFRPTGPNVFPDPTGSILYCLITQDQAICRNTIFLSFYFNETISSQLPHPQAIIFTHVVIFSDPTGPKYTFWVLYPFNLIHEPAELVPAKLVPVLQFSGQSQNLDEPAKMFRVHGMIIKLGSTPDHSPRHNQIQW